MSSAQQKLDELEILQSIYPDLIAVDPQDYLECQEHVDSTDISPTLRFAIKFGQVELAVTLPGSYPDCEPAQIRLSSTRLTPKDDTALTVKISSVIKENKGEAVILQVISDVSELLEEIVLEEEAAKDKVVTPVQKCSYTRLWYYAHHIYSREKRTNMLQWSKDLSLTGFILPGKPGIICIEGEKKFCKEFNSLVRAMNWQLLKLQHEELDLEQEDIKFDGFKELIFDVHGRDNKHQDLGQFRQYLIDIGLDDIFENLFHI